MAQANMPPDDHSRIGSCLDMACHPYWLEGAAPQATALELD